MNTQEEEQTVSVWDYLEDSPNDAERAEYLYRWGLNYDRDQNPFLVYLDLIGWTAENYGQTERLGATVILDYVGAGHLADALTEWSDKPEQVWQWVEGLMNTEGV